MVERWNIGFQKDISHFNFIVNPAHDNAIWHFKNTICRYQHLCHMSYAVLFCSICHMAQLKAGPLIQYCIIPEPIIPLFHCSIIPIVSEAN